MTTYSSKKLDELAADLERVKVRSIWNVRVLLSIHSMGQVTASELADHLKIGSSTFLDLPALHDKGWVVRDDSHGEIRWSLAKKIKDIFNRHLS